MCFMIDGMNDKIPVCLARTLIVTTHIKGRQKLQNLSTGTYDLIFLRYLQV